jgi:transposase
LGVDISILEGNFRDPGGTIVYRYVYAHRQVLDRVWSRMRSPVSSKGGRPSVSRYRVVEAVIWICLTRGRWMDLPKGFASGKTAHRTFKRWVASGLWKGFLWELATNTPTGQALGLEQCFENGELRSLAFEEVLELVQHPDSSDPHRTWMMMLFLSPMGANRTRERGAKMPASRVREVEDMAVTL